MFLELLKGCPGNFLGKMKKLYFCLITLLIVFSLLGCTKKTDENGFCQEIKTAVDLAKKKNQDILVAVTMAGEDENSADLIENVLKTETFKNEVLSSYVVLHIDFSQSSYEKTVIKEESSKNEQKAAEKFADIMYENSKLASMLNVQVTPSFYILTKDQYYITKLEYIDGNQTYTAFKSELDSHSNEIETIHSYLNAINKEKGLAKIEAIDSLYETIDISNRAFYEDMIETVVKLDKNNESGLLSKYLLASADIKGSKCFLSGDSAGAAQAYIKICDEKALLPEHKQQAYYMGAYIMAMSGLDDYSLILSYLQKSIDANPEGQDVASIKNVYDYIVNSVAAMGLDVPVPAEQ